MRIRLVALDLDGTCLTSERIPHKDLRPAFLRAQEAGIEVCLASGRNYRSLKQIQEMLNIEAHIISANGCVVLHSNGTSIQRSQLSPELIQMTCDYALKESAYVHAESPEEMVALFDSPLRTIYQDRSRIKVRVAGRDAMVSSSLTHILLIDSPDRIAIHHARLGELYGDRVQLLVSEKDYLEILPAGVHKGTGLKALTQALDIPLEETAALGDYWNDLQLLQAAGFSAVVSNAVSGLESHANMTFSSNDEGGAAEFLDWIVYNGTGAAKS